MERLVEQEMADQDLYRKLQLKVAGDIGGDANISTVRKALEEAILPGYFIEYHHAYDYAGTVYTAIEAVEDLLHDGQAEAVIELTEFALHKTEDAMENIDDSSGHMHTILENLQTLHLEACKDAKPDPQARGRPTVSFLLGHGSGIARGRQGGGYQSSA